MNELVKQESAIPSKNDFLRFNGQDFSANEQICRIFIFAPGLKRN
jgi:hypothetical protein